MEMKVRRGKSIREVVNVIQVGALTESRGLTKPLVNKTKQPPR